MRIKQPHSYTCRNVTVPYSTYNTPDTCDFNDFSHAPGLGLALPHAHRAGARRFQLQPQSRPFIPSFIDYNANVPVRLIPHVGSAGPFQLFLQHRAEFLMTTSGRQLAVIVFEGVLVGDDRVPPRLRNPTLPTPPAPIPKGPWCSTTSLRSSTAASSCKAMWTRSYVMLSCSHSPSAANRNTPQRALQRLIDRDLILQQMATAQPVTPPTPEQVRERITELRSLIPECARYQCKTDAGWQAFLAAKGLTEKEVETHWAQRMLILSFIQSRFGSGVRITPAEIADYYNKTLSPQFHDRKMSPPALATVSARIEEILLQQRVSSLLLEWLQSLKSEGSVSILDPAYGQVGTTGSGDEESGGQS